MNTAASQVWQPCDTQSILPIAESTFSKERDDTVSPLLSLPKIAEPGFLAQAFAVDSSGCQS
jgi:hypothetical protein